MDKVKVKVQKNELRLQIPYEDGMIIINEIHPQLKQELLTVIVDILQNGKDFDEKKLFMDIVNKCTNVEFDGDIFEIEYVSHEVQMLVNEIMIMIQEVIQEAYQILRLALQQFKNELEEKEVLEGKNGLVKLVEYEKKKEEEALVEKKEVKKVNRPRGRRNMR